MQIRFDRQSKGWAARRLARVVKATFDAAVAIVKAAAFGRSAAMATATALAALAAVSPATAQMFPQAGKPIRLVVPLAAGGSLDIQSRAIAQKITEQSGVNVIVENKPGASMMLAANEVARAAPDGHTVFYAPSTVIAQNPHTLLNVAYDPFRDFTPVTLAARGPLVLTAYSGLGVGSVAELVAWGKANPGKLVFASFGIGSSSHVFAEAFAKAAGIEIVHVPYKGTADAVRDLFEGRVQAYFDAAPTAIINAQTGKVKLLGVVAPARSPFLPNVPTVSEQGVAGIDLTSWIAILGPAKLPAEITAKLNAMFAQALSNPQVREAIARGAWETSPTTAEEAAAEMRAAYDRWGEMIRRIGFQKQ